MNTVEMNVLEQAAADLDAAADVIDAKGWCRHRMQDPLGRVCAQGAVLSVLLNDLHQGMTSAEVVRLDVALEELRRYLDRNPINGGSVPYWNDAVAGSQEVVTDTFRRAAKGVRERVQQ